MADVWILAGFAVCVALVALVVIAMVGGPTTPGRRLVWRVSCDSLLLALAFWLGFGFAAFS